VFFYAFTSPQTLSQRIRLFIRCFGADKLFKSCGKIFQAGATYRPFAEYALLCIGIGEDVKALDARADDFLTSEVLELLLQNLIKRSLNTEIGYSGDPDLVMEHFSRAWDDRRKYLLDYLILARLRFGSDSKHTHRRKLTKFLRMHAKKSSEVQRYYAGLLLAAPLPKVSENQLGVSPQVFEELCEIAKRLRSHSRGTQAEEA